MQWKSFLLAHSALKQQLFVAIKAIIAAFFALGTPVALGNTAYSNLNTKSPFYTNVGFVIDIAGALGEAEAAQFTSQSTGQIDSILLGLTYHPSFGGRVNVYIEPSPIAGGVGGIGTTTFLGTATSTTNFFDPTYGSHLTTVSLVSIPITIEASQSYYLILQAANPRTYTIWGTNNTHAGGNIALSEDNGATFAFPSPGDLPAFQIGVHRAALPDSGSTAMLLLGCMPLLIMFGRVVSCRTDTRTH